MSTFGGFSTDAPQNSREEALERWDALCATGSPQATAEKDTDHA